MPPEGQEATTNNESTTVDQRAAALMDQIRKEDSESRRAQDLAEESGEVATSPAEGEEAPEEAPEEEKAEASPAELTEAQKRKARIEEIRKKQLESFQKKDELKTLKRQNEELLQRLQAKEQTKDAGVDPKIAALAKALESRDQLAILNLVGQHVDPKQLGNWILEQNTNPERIAELHAKTAEERIMQALAERDKRIEELGRQLQERDQQSKLEQKRNEFASVVREHRTEHPYAARLLKNDPKSFYHLADQHADILAKTEDVVTYDAILAKLNEQLEHEVLILSADEDDESQASTSKHTLTTAAAKAKTLNNRAASTRSTIVEDDPDVVLPYEERIARAKRFARAG